MTARIGQGLRRFWWVAAILALLGGYWLLPISGQVLVTAGPGSATVVWPQVQVEGSGAGDRRVGVTVTDTMPWAHVLLTVNGEAAGMPEWRSNPGGTWTWRWALPAGTRDEERTIVFYHDCDTGCRERARLTLGGTGTTAAAAQTRPTDRVPTKLGVVLAHPDRDWHGRSGWTVELTYARPTGAGEWGVDALAARVHTATARGLRVLVRVDYDRGQALPPANDYLALTDYLHHLRRLARDERLRQVAGYVIGSGFNARDGNSLAPDRPVTPAWYARVFNGYGDAVGRSDNAVQTIRRENPRVAVLVGPVRPWSTDQGGGRTAPVGAPWLDYFDALVVAVDEAARAKEAAGIPLAAPDGFALQAAGRPAAAEQHGRPAADEPRLDLPWPAFGGAQAGFRVYRDWLAIVNAYPATRGRPAYITSANTFAADEGTPPAQNYPRGWLSAALAEIDAEPQVQALCWFLDGALGDRQWEWFSLVWQSGRLIEAADEFDRLLQAAPRAG